MDSACQDFQANQVEYKQQLDKLIELQQLAPAERKLEREKDRAERNDELAKREAGKQLDREFKYFAILAAKDHRSASDEAMYQKLAAKFFNNR